MGWYLSKILAVSAGSVRSPSLLLRYTHFSSALFSASITSRMAEPTRPVPPVTMMTLPMVNGGAERESLRYPLVEGATTRAICACGLVPGRARRSGLTSIRTFYEAAGGCRPLVARGLLFPFCETTYALGVSLFFRNKMPFRDF